MNVTSYLFLKDMNRTKINSLLFFTLFSSEQYLSSRGGRRWSLVCKFRAVFRAAVAVEEGDTGGLSATSEQYSEQ
ncbi:hypothetical protein AMTR_s00006p00261270 [Amborella trichopoda]|uniref:Uncharacterized protein n=1 Tax=Amborella trichopoda TaxID=13333 RepID=W1P7H8_AMBTC|nr:hypothetical protein AMTR_s00006p00261270 [Amborella trichopoda]